MVSGFKGVLGVLDGPATADSESKTGGGGGDTEAGGRLFLPMLFKSVVSEVHRLAILSPTLWPCCVRSYGKLDSTKVEPVQEFQR